MGLEKADPVPSGCGTSSRSVMCNYDCVEGASIANAICRATDVVGGGQKGLTTTRMTMTARAIPGNSPQMRNCFSDNGRSPAIIFFDWATM